MSLALHDTVFPAAIRTLESMSAILEKAAAHAEAHKIEPSVLLNYRLAPNMFALMRQVQIVTDFAKGLVARLAGVEVPNYADDEATFAQLQERIAKTLDYVKSFTPAQIDGSETRQVTVKAGGQDIQFSGVDYVFKFFFPNFYFHATTAYDILRHAGVDLGKRDFLGWR